MPCLVPISFSKLREWRSASWFPFPPGCSVQRDLQCWCRNPESLQGLHWSDTSSVIPLQLGPHATCSRADSSSLQSSSPLLAQRSVPGGGRGRSNSPEARRNWVSLRKEEAQTVGAQREDWDQGGQGGRRLKVIYGLIGPGGSLDSIPKVISSPWKVWARKSHDPGAIWGSSVCLWWSPYREAWVEVTEVSRVISHHLKSWDSGNGEVLTEFGEEDGQGGACPQTTWLPHLWNAGGRGRGIVEKESSIWPGWEAMGSCSWSPEHKLERPRLGVLESKPTFGAGGWSQAGILGPGRCLGIGAGPDIYRASRGLQGLSNAADLQEGELAGSISEGPQPHSWAAFAIPHPYFQAVSPDWKAGGREVKLGV